MPLRTRRGGRTLFARYAYPPNELGYCGPGDAGLSAGATLENRAREFDGAWPYLEVLSAVGGVEPLDDEVVRSYWVGGGLLGSVDPDLLLAALRRAFTGQVTGLLDAVPAGKALAHHSFHVFVVYPWARFLDRDPATPLRVMQQCRIRSGTVESVDGDHAVVSTHPLTLRSGVLSLGPAVVERLRWRRNGTSLTAAPHPGDRVAAHWDWVCDTLSDEDVAALTAATRATLDLVNDLRTAVDARAPTRSR
ncbi:hypothetical protein AU196_20310 [Mycobacterium sp. IS-1742]|uniref:DUF6390 family protein n=1 Tax=Mycobacterium sp. IS-1742 TaxID=1772285 RepID=UPI00073FC224|nr:DUF6390 family protein [Mycobacterium sp. IS-1742]KUI24246.1 hypothetical protein AU196_20310 [Mycobacterium sp. IS-1742]